MDIDDTLCCYVFVELSKNHMNNIFRTLCIEKLEFKFESHMYSIFNFSMVCVHFLSHLSREQKFQPPLVFASTNLNLSIEDVVIHWGCAMSGILPSALPTFQISRSQSSLWAMLLVVWVVEPLWGLSLPATLVYGFLRKQCGCSQLGRLVFMDFS